MKKNSLILVLLSLSLLTGIFTPQFEVKEVNAWGLLTHRWHVDQAITVMPTEWQPIFNYWIIELKAGINYPDNALQDWENHLWYPDELNGGQLGDGTPLNGPYAVNDTFWEARALLEQGDWENGTFKLGQASHYLGDLSWGVHTGLRWAWKDGVINETENANGHVAIEGDVNSAISGGVFDSLTYSAPSVPTDLVTFTISATETAHLAYDDYVAAYPTHDTSGPVTNNATLKNIVGAQLGNAVTNIASLWLKAVEGLTPPDITVETSLGQIVIDNEHENDYSDDALTSIGADLSRLGYQINFTSEYGGWANALPTADYFIITATFGSNPFSEIELVALENWLAAGSQNLLISSRGDFASGYTVPLDIDNINTLLTRINSHIQVQDDNVYTGDPTAYQPWYARTGVFEENIVPGLFDGVDIIQFYSPSSLRFTDVSAVDVLSWGTPYFYQTDQFSPAPHTIYDNVDDGTGGDSIPMMAQEVLETGEHADRVVVTGTTIWSDFDYSNAFANNTIFMQNLFSYFTKQMMHLEGNLNFSTTLVDENTNPWLNQTIDLNYHEGDKDNLSLLFTYQEMEFNNYLSSATLTTTFDSAYLAIDSTNYGNGSWLFDVNPLQTGLTDFKLDFNQTGFEQIRLIVTLNVTMTGTILLDENNELWSDQVIQQSFHKGDLDNLSLLFTYQDTVYNDYLLDANVATTYDSDYLAVSNTAYDNGSWLFDINPLLQDAINTFTIEFSQSGYESIQIVTTFNITITSTTLLNENNTSWSSAIQTIQRVFNEGDNDNSSLFFTYQDTEYNEYLTDVVIHSTFDSTYLAVTEVSYGNGSWLFQVNPLKSGTSTLDIMFSLLGYEAQQLIFTFDVTEPAVPTDTSSSTPTSTTPTNTTSSSETDSITSTSSWGSIVIIPLSLLFLAIIWHRRKK
ncbi:MAG: hypothetical protein ACXAC7_14225 [Candidatus Hodarchaeales archaeon]